MATFRPMLAAEAPETVSLPAYASAKLDGIRGVAHGGQVVSRTVKPLPNRFIQSSMNWEQLENLDGEFIVGSPTATDVYQVTESGVMTRAGEPDFTFYVFDFVPGNLTMPYEARLAQLQDCEPALESIGGPRLKLLPQKLITSQEELTAFEESCLDIGFEGIMLRKPDSPYKFGRSTQKQAYLLKLKRFKDAEAVIIGYEELMHNTNAATTNALGYTERSSHKDGKVAGGTLGALVVRDMTTGVEFNIGTGFSASLRQTLWDIRDTLINKICVYKYFPKGVKDKPRHPVFKGWRSAIDIGEPT